MWTLDQAIERRRVERKVRDLEDYIAETQTQDRSALDELKELRTALRKLEAE